MTEYLSLVARWLLSLLHRTGYLGVGLALFLEGAWFPITSEVFLLLAGFLSGEKLLNYWGVVFSGTAGYTLGAAVPYLLARARGEDFLFRYGRYALIFPSDVERVKSWFQRYGEAAVLLTRCIPVLRNAVSFPAGLAHLPLRRFWGYTFAGFFPWAAAVTLAGRLAGEHWARLSLWLQRVDDLLAAVLAGVAVAIWLWLVARRRKRPV
ncbi:MAG: DedA family protein [Bacillota bacterium]|nr:DedA family protein [Bacillota bacterium]